MKKVRAILILLMIIATSWTTIQIQGCGSGYKTQEIKQATVEIDKTKLILDKFRNECKRVSKLIVLEGQYEIVCTYSTDQREVTDKSKQNAIKFLVNKFKDLQVKEINVVATYKYEYVLDLDMIKPTIEGDAVVITLSRHLLTLNPVTEIQNKTIIGTKTHLLSGNFTPAQTKAVMTRTWLHVTNCINSDNELANQALDSAVNNIKDMADKLGAKVRVEIINTEPIENNEVEVLNRVKP